MTSLRITCSSTADRRGVSRRLLKALVLKGIRRSKRRQIVADLLASSARANACRRSILARLQKKIGGLSNRVYRRAVGSIGGVDSLTVVLPSMVRVTALEQIGGSFSRACGSALSGREVLVAVFPMSGTAPAASSQKKMVTIRGAAGARGQRGQRGKAGPPSTRFGLFIKAGATGGLKCNHAAAGLGLGLMGSTFAWRVAVVGMQRFQMKLAGLGAQTSMEFPSLRLGGHLSPFIALEAGFSVIPWDQADDQPFTHFMGKLGLAWPSSDLGRSGVRGRLAIALAGGANLYRVARLKGAVVEPDVTVAFIGGVYIEGAVEWFYR